MKKRRLRIHHVKRTTLYVLDTLVSATVGYYVAKHLSKRDWDKNS